MPTGGVDLDNVHEWLQAGRIAVGVGGNLTRGTTPSDYSPIVERTQSFVKAVRTARAGQV